MRPRKDFKVGTEDKGVVLGLEASVPLFPEFVPIALSHSDIVKRYAERAQPANSEHTFANLYVWRRHNNFSLSLLNNSLLVLARPDDEPAFFLPPLGENDLQQTATDMLALLKDEGLEPRMARVPKPLALRLAEIEGFQVREDRNNWDYVYQSSDLIKLPGRKYHRKRNHIRQFVAAVTYEYRPLTPDLIPGCLELQRTWCAVRDCFAPEHISLAEEHKAVTEALENLTALGAVGGVILIDGRVQAFSLGEPLNRDTFVIHFEKASPDYPGIYQAINRDFCADACAGFTYVNREQDLGEPGLRRAKESYYPVTMIEKFIVNGDF